MSTSALRLPDRIETPRLTLRPCIADDLPPFAAFMQDDESTRTLLFADEQKSEAGAREILEAVLDSYETEWPIFVLAVCAKETGAYVGSCGLSPLESGDVECFYTTLREHWSRGYATEALQALLDYAFGELKLDRIIARVGDDNPGSRRVAEKLGFENDGSWFIESPSTGSTEKDGITFVIERRRWLVSN